MSATTTEPGGVTAAAAAEYVAAVAAALTGVPDAERQELLDDLADHLAELAAEDDESLAVRLGTPEAYAAELVASAGISVGPPTPPDPVRAWRRATDVVSGYLHSEAAEAFRAFLPELRAGWWVLRGWCVVALLAVVATPDQRRVFPVPEVFGNLLMSLVALGAACVLSVRVGRATGWMDRGVTLLGAVGLVVAATHGDRTEYVHESYPYGMGQLMAPDGRVIQNIWPYDGDGEPMEGVLLFDQDGVPLDVGGEATFGQIPIPGLFPQRQLTYEYDPASGVEREVPISPPIVSIPQFPTSGSSDDGSTTTTAPADEGATTTVVRPAGG